ncbi:MAG: hypothetical protein ACLQBB_06195 [Solirubrobacteraceae bacterium]
MIRRGRPRSRFVLALAAMLAAASAGAAPAAAQSPWWQLDATSAPSNLQPAHEAQFVVTATNIGDAPVDATSTHVHFSYELPAGITVQGMPEALASRGVPGRGAETSALSGCAVSALPGQQSLVSCEFAEVLPPFVRLMMRIKANVAAAVQQPLEAVARVEGGATTGAHLLEPLHLSEAAVAFGVEHYELTPEDEGGAPDLQAGSHPFQLTTTLDLDQTLQEYDTPSEQGTFPSAVALPRNLHFKLPPGLIGNVDTVPQCSKVDFSTPVAEDTVNLCPPDTAIGVASLVANDPKPAGFESWSVPVFNLTPEEGEPARFGFLVEGVPVILRTAVPTGGEYGVEVSVEEVSQAVQLLSSQVTFWGVPADPRHDTARGWECLGEATWYGGQPHAPCPKTTAAEPPAFLTLPTSCERAPETTVEGDSWPAGAQAAAQRLEGQTRYVFPSVLSDCGALAFEPSLTLTPEQLSASTPTGVTVGVRIPQAGLISAGGHAEPAVRDTTVTLPAGLQLSPPAANGLQACSAEAFGSPFTGAEEELQVANASFLPGFPTCAEAAKVGSVTITTPVLPQPLTGAVYLADEHTAPFRPPLVLYLVAEDHAAGVLVKLAGSVTPNPVTGQLISTFANTPQLPFEDLTLHFFGGQRASLSTPPLCGTYSGSASFTPWSGGQVAEPGSTFNVDSGPGGGACPPSPLPLAAGFTAGASNRGADAFTDFTLSLSKPDGQQALTGISVHLPPGISAMIANVTPCPEPPAGAEWACGTSSLIGHATESSGLGGEPVVLGGDVYLTSGYDGAPFGLLVRTLVAVGPFDLGHVDVRSRINVDPNTAAVSVTTDPGPRGEGIPTILDGVPVQLKALQVTVQHATGEGRPFEFNPTNCRPMAVTGSFSGSEGAVQAVSAPFTVTGCGSLPFKPTLTATTAGRASRANGASLVVRVTSSAGQANIAGTVLTLPKALPSRQSTIRQACPDTTFDQNPAGCPQGSVIGSATVHTPVLHSPLTGPGYLVSHGGAAFPDVEFVLQGEGIRLILDGQTNISKGITTSSFKSVPDAPIESFEASLPEGPHSALGAYLSSGSYDLCGTKLTMPTTITGQNGLALTQTTKIAVTGCTGVASYHNRRLTRAQKLHRALAACRKRYRHARHSRAHCEAHARTAYQARRSAQRRAPR